MLTGNGDVFCRIMVFKVINIAVELEMHIYYITSSSADSGINEASGKKFMTLFITQTTI